MGTTFRFIQEPDVRQLLQVEKAANATTFDDPDFGTVQWYHHWTVDVCELMKLIRQRRAVDTGTHDTRTIVVERSKTESLGDGVEAVVPWLCGGFTYEIHDDGFKVLFISVHPEAKGLYGEILDWMKERAKRSPKRKNITIFLRDKEEAGIRALIPVLVSKGFILKLVPNFFEDCDGWRFTLN